MSRIAHNIRWGLIVGLFFGVFFSIIATVLVALGSGRRSAGTETYSLPALLALYLGSGIIAGLMFGIMRPLARWRAGAILIGLICALVVGIAVGILIDGLPSSWDDASWFTLVLWTIVWGVLLGNSFWKHPLPELKEFRRSKRLM